MLKSNQFFTLLCIGILMLVSSSIYAEDWPQWRGPNRDGISADTGLLKEWPENGPPLAWEIEQLGGGDGAPAIADGRIFIMSHRGDDEVVIALSEKNGKELWSKRLGPVFIQRVSQSKEGPACTPAIDGERLYVEGMGGNVACLKVEDGEILWQISMADDFGGRAPMWSFRESPLVDENKVICTPGSTNAIMVALDKFTGKTIWKTGEPGSSANSDSSENRNSSSTKITGTKDPDLYMSEHFGMQSFSYKIPNGKYQARLHFAETYEGISGVGQRVFSFNVQGNEFKDFDVWAKAGGPRRAYIETVPVDVTNGEFRIDFTRKVENPAIKAIEIIPDEEAAPSQTPVRIKAGLSSSFKDSSGNVWQPDSGFEGGMTSQVSSGGGFMPGGGNRNFGPGNNSGMGVAYSSPIVVDFEGQRQYIQFTAKAVIGVSASDGKLLWQYAKPANRMGLNCSTPLYHNGTVFASSAYRAGGGLVKLTKTSNGNIEAEEVYFTNEMQSHHGGVILYDGYLYGASGGNEGGALVCLDFKTGNVQWDQRDVVGRRAKGSSVLAEGLLYYRQEDGTMLLIEPNSEKYIERGRFMQPNRKRQPAWAYPVIANGKLYIRDQDILFCYDVKAN